MKQTREIEKRIVGGEKDHGTSMVRKKAVGMLGGYRLP